MEMKIENLIRQDLKGFKPYEVHEEHCKFKLDANESPFGITDAVRKKIITWLENDENLNIYPDTNQVQLRQAVAKFYGLAAEHVVCGVGSDQLIDYLCKVFLNPGDVVLAPSPSFSMYSLSAKLNHGKIVEMPLNSEYTYNVGEIIEAINLHRPKITFLCTPNNPTGCSLSNDEIAQIATNSEGIIVVDEAYAEFSNESMAGQVLKHENVIVLRTFSKAYGLAGARIGYGLACEALIKTLEIVKAPYSLSTLSMLLAVEILNDMPAYKVRISEINAEKLHLMDELKKFGWLKVYPSDANFLFVESERKIADLFKQNGIMVRQFESKNGLERFRFSVGTKEANEALVSAIKIREV